MHVAAALIRIIFDCGRVHGKASSITQRSSLSFGNRR
jgi:hypothetical protein